MLNINDKAPNFNLKGNDNKSYSLESFDNQKLIIYFYPKDNTPGCTLQGIEFTQYKDKFNDLGYKVIGVSNDSYESHCKFAAQHDIGILLLSDDGKKMSKEYSVLNKLGIISRSTFILNEQHDLVDVHYGLSSKGHVELIYNSVKKIKNTKEE